VSDLTNILANLPDATSHEQIETLLSSKTGRIERIVSKGQSSPAGFWYDQVEAEFVLLLRGEAALRFENESEPRILKSGDMLVIPAHRRHRVDWTSRVEETIWLAVFLSPD
jgi:cupin 2 domain-containing protein